MIPRRILGAAALVLAAGSLGGCVAAAIPLAAAGMMARSQLDGGNEVAEPAVPKRTALAPLPSASPVSIPGYRVMADMTELPPPSPGPAGSGEAVTRFSVYALQQAMQDPAREPRLGALLAEPGSLRPARQECGTRPPAILIDVDPGRATFDPLGAPRPAPSLAPALLSLREQGVAIVWQSRLGENFAEPVRAVLRETGLDPLGRDRLLLADSVEDRKQTLRDDLAANLCVVAILGDERADFDELYLYLKDPDVALPLESMIGRGWFLADPIIEEAGNGG
ncbi:hypothetical protein [Qipengyuania sp. MTN3-11]|uniref:hypothetical protein n=1 Tax=Qipengyuania sp. MTN3-11 TaxID=3056557 RepID=UPI0036F397CF